MNTAVQVTSEKGDMNTCYQNKYGINMSDQRGGSYPTTMLSKYGSVQGGDLCFSVQVMKKNFDGYNGWSQFRDGWGVDCPNSNEEWPNAWYGSPCFLAVWIK